VEISDKNLNEFRAWLLERGRSSGTANLYISNLRSCDADKNGLTHRLVAGKLAPNSLRTNLASLRAWAVYSEDTKLAKRLSDIRLPPARNVRIKLPLEVVEWKKVIRHLQTCKMANEAMRHVLILMAIRGFRSGDILRMLRTEMEAALSTGKLVYEGKGRKRHEFSATPIRPQLEALVGFTGWYRVRDLISTSGNPEIARKKVWRAARRTAHKVGVFKMNPHRYRHTFATNYLKELKGDPQAIIKLQKYMGWESMNTAARYVSAVSQDELDEIGAGLVSGLLE
jgi:integrase